MTLWRRSDCHPSLRHPPASGPAKIFFSDAVYSFVPTRRKTAPPYRFDISASKRHEKESCFLWVFFNQPSFALPLSAHLHD